MRRSTAALLAVLAGSSLVIAQRAPAAPSFLIRKVTLFDGNGGPPQPGVDVLPKDGRIVHAQAGGAR
jgi:hypothetical protein